MDKSQGSPQTGESAPSATVWTGEAFASQFQASFRILWGIAIAIVRDSATAEDVVQEAALLALQKREQFEAGTSLTAWMAQMVRYIAMNQVRKDRRRRHRDTDLSTIDGNAHRSNGSVEPEMGPVSTPSSDGDRRAFDHRIEQALDSVGDIARACLLLRTVEGLE